MLHDSLTKYRPFEPIQIADRTWPNRVLRAAPTAGQWYLTSLRDGRRLRNTSGVLDFAPANTTGTNCTAKVNLASPNLATATVTVRLAQ